MAPGTTTREPGEKVEEIMVRNEKSDSPNFEQLASTENGRDEQNLEAQNGQQRYPLRRKINPLRLQKVPDVPEERVISREYGASLLSRIFFLWVIPFMKVGYLRDLEIQDISKINPSRSIDILVGKLDAAMQQRLAQGSKRPLLRSIYDTFKKELWIGAVGQNISFIIVVVAPYLVRKLVAYSMEAEKSQQSGRPGPNIGQGMGYAVGLFCMLELQSLTASYSLYVACTVGGQVKGVLTSNIFSKAMKLSARAKTGAITPLDEEGRNEGNLKTQVESEKKPPKAHAADDTQEVCGWDNGRIIALMGVDASRVDQGFAFLHLFVAVFPSLIVALIILLVNIGYSALAGYALLIVGLSCLMIAVGQLVHVRMDINKVTDERVSLTQEILLNVRSVKFFGWENSFLARLQASRKREIRFLQRFFSIQLAVISAIVSTPGLASMLAFITYASTGHQLLPDRIFAALAVFNSIRVPLSGFNLSTTKVTDAWASLKRFEGFLMAEERDEKIHWDSSMKDAIDMRDASFTWEQASTSRQEDDSGDLMQDAPSSQAPNTTSNHNNASPTCPFTVMDINLEVGRGELLAIIGTVGSGKSSFLGALAGDMRLTEGEVRMGTTRAFCPQYAWIQNTSVRNNILFGTDYDEERYNAVVDACALQHDLAILPHGDLTEIGERGITISGGQKQRFNIARAIYSNSGLILMDDPLSAVDAHVGRHIMDNAICGLLKDRCRILATHQLHVLSRCDRIAVMDGGRIHAIGTFDDLMRTSDLFQGLMLSTPHQEASSMESESGRPGHGEQKQNPSEKTRRETPATALMQQEERSTTSTAWKIWTRYIAASGTFLNLPIVVILLSLSVGSTILTGIWLSFWTSDRFPSLSLGEYMATYAGLSISQGVTLYMQAVHIKSATARASRTMFQRAMYRVLRAPVGFFDTTPLGRITNRLSQDVQVTDTELGESLRIFLYSGAQVIGIMVLVSAFYHYFAIAAAASLLIAIFSVSYYLPSARSLKRHEAILRSVVFSRFGEAIIGSTCIQAYQKEESFRMSIHEAIDSMNGAYFLTFANRGWLNTRLDFVGNLLILVTGILVASSRFQVSPSFAGMTLSYILSISLQITFAVRMYSSLENDMNSVERVDYYGTNLEEEAALYSAEVGPSWPENGRITFSNVQMRYRHGLPLVLNRLTMDVQGGERIGIVGRTGAGKSSIMSALFRLTELSGGIITIDGVDIASIGLHDLRTRLAIIPQEPTLFKGTIRSNLDPFEEHTDLELWSAMRKAHLVDQELPDDNSSGINESPVPFPGEEPASAKTLHLDTHVDQEGLNFSLGQRQLMGLARALVRDSRIIVCDEATSSVDFETDNKVQKTMTRGFEGKTVLCIAHRLRTIINYDRICVMDQGQIAEMDTPLNLWNKTEGIFRGMCDKSGITREDIRK